jgi:hypothetical protein
MAPSLFLFDRSEASCGNQASGTAKGRPQPGDSAVIGTEKADAVDGVDKVSWRGQEMIIDQCRCDTGDNSCAGRDGVDKVNDVIQKLGR